MFVLIEGGKRPLFLDSITRELIEKRGVSVVSVKLRPKGAGEEPRVRVGSGDLMVLNKRGFQFLYIRGVRNIATDHGASFSSEQDGVREEVAGPTEVPSGDDLGERLVGELPKLRWRLKGEEVIRGGMKSEREKGGVGLEAMKHPQ